MHKNKTLATLVIHQHWPDSVRVEYAGECPVCHFYALWSHVDPERDSFTPDGTYQECGYYCLNCEWSNAGGRKISQIDIAARGGAGKGEPA